MNVFPLVLALALVTPTAVECRRGVFRGLRKAVGDCPYQRPAVNCQQGLFLSEHEEECFEDEDCETSLKCCSRGCDMKCVAPVNYSEWCEIPVDLGIVFEPYKTVLGNITRVVRNMSVSKESTHIALRTIERESELLLKFDGRQTPKKVKRIIESITPKQPSGKIIRPLISALELAKDMFNETSGGRPEAIKVLLVFTDGMLGEDEEEHRLEAASRALKDSGILVQSINIPEMEDTVNLMNLVEIASSDVYVWNEVDNELLTQLKKLEREPCNY